MVEEIVYRLASDADIERINVFYNNIYNKNRTYEQFYWEYNSAPAGKAIYVIAEHNNKVVGTQCAIPYYVIDKNNSQTLTAKSEDTLVSPDYRGKSIFENMYSLLIDECKKNGIEFIWGFTYADRPFRKIGFEIPYKSTMGLMALKPLKATRYFYLITAKKNISSFLKILVLCIFSYVKFLFLFFSSSNKIEIDFDDIDYNNNRFNYLKHDKLFGLKLDQEFLDYRIARNPYNSNYKTVNYHLNGALKASIKFNRTKDNVAYIIHVFFADDLSLKTRNAFLLKAIQQSEIKKCTVIRFWGFNHNIENNKEIENLKESQFVFINRGIYFVGLKLTERSVNFKDFALSRMASQGTD
jgi:N-acetylglutamate synthase-like GNAT family acetyltransferase